MRRLLALILAVAMLASAWTVALAAPSDYLGKPLADFTVQTIDGGEFTLSEALKDHDMVLINLWASWCGPCGMEFPFLEEAYEQYSERVAVIALSTEPKDTTEVIRDYAESRGLTFPVGSDSGTGLASYFEVYSIPTSVVVDRFGNVAMAEAGAQTNKAVFEGLFDYFLDDGYTETEVLDGFPAPRLTAAVDEAELNAAANVDGGALAFRNPEDGNIWPMLPVEVDGRLALASSNAGIQDSASRVSFTATATEGDALAFEFKTSLLSAYDALYVQLDGEIVKRFTGVHDWTTWALPLPTGEHEISLGCEALSPGGIDIENCVWIDDVRVATGDEASALLAAVPAYPVAEAFGVKVADATKRRIEFDDPNGVIAASFEVGDGWIVDGESATVEIALEAGDDPETAMIVTASGIRQTVAETLTADGASYSVALPLEEGAFDLIYAVPGMELEDEAREQTLMVLGGEAGADAFVEYIQSYGYEAGWHYAEGPAGETATAEAGTEGVYTVTVVDQDGTPVPGVYVNFCTDETCQPVQSDENGVITFTGEPDAYHLQILTVPEGYGFEADFEAYIGPEPGALTIEVTRN